MGGYDDIHSQCFKDMVSAYQKVRQDGELHIPDLSPLWMHIKSMKAKLTMQADKCKSTSLS